MALRGTGLVPFAGTDIGPLFSFRRDLNRLFDNSLGTFGGASRWAPAVDVHEDNNTIYLDVELPGINPQDVDISVDNGILTVQGEKHGKHENNREDERFHTIERSYGSFMRSFQLPQGIDEKQIHANFDNGVVTIDIPKAAIPQPRRIQISGTQQAGGENQGREQVSGRGTSRGGKGSERMVAGNREAESQQAQSPQRGSSSSK
ncbi:MAG TPA: Hsp20/alpha crystallin family protein [Gemmatimonadaceae bacterium]|nr:Hsp20/alpha crystallin family protein [Gemmatimonadaceae bacterium]